MTDAGSLPHTVAFMDFGTNSIRLLVVRLEANGSSTVLHQLKETVRLGEGEFTYHRLRREAIDRAVAVARGFATLARSSGVDEIHAVATAATREAENRQVFLRRLADEAGIDVRVVSGLEEARLIYLGVASGINLEGKQALFVDIGGGSTEVIVGTQNEQRYLNSMKLGAIRLSNQFLEGVTRPVTESQYSSLRAYIRTHAARTLHELREYKLDLAVGSSGTLENLTDITARMFLKRPWQRGDAFTYAQCSEAIRMLCSLPLEERRRVPGLNPARADIIIGGVAVIDVLMEELGIETLRFADRGLREGLLADYLERQGHPDFEVPLRERSILQTGRKCRFDEPHARKVADLSLQLFDSAREMGLHTLGDWERELLEYAALLHHIGSFVSYSGYQRHTYYLIRNAELLGFDETEDTILAYTCLFHRGALPRKRDTEFMALSSKEQERLLVMSTLLRLAENLDRSQAGNVISCALRPGHGQRVVLELTAGHDCEVEVWGLRDQVDVFGKVFGRSLEVSIPVPAAEAAS